MAFLSPLRYPGGKGDLANFMKLVYLENDLRGNSYIEPYAGGAAVAMALLLQGYADQIYINDLDRSIYAFWHSVLMETNALCSLIRQTQVTMDEWYQQQEIQKQPEASLLSLGFSTFFLNRTNRSGIIKGGVIGGKQQTGKYKLDARYNREELIQRIQRIAEYSDCIYLYNMDAIQFMQEALPGLPVNSLVYLDPPYYVKGEGLYTNYYQHNDHQQVAHLVSTIGQRWIVSYDDVDAIQHMYGNFRHVTYNLSYSATDRYRGKEIMFFSNNLIIPHVASPANVPNKNVHQATLFL